MSRAEGWKQCPNCSIVIELVVRCNHMTCFTCDYEFCFSCLRHWDGDLCLGQSELWEEDRLVAAGEARVQAQEEAAQQRMPAHDRRVLLEAEMNALRANEGCTHTWVHRNGYRGECERCGFALYMYGMVCSELCRSTVC